MKVSMINYFSIGYTEKQNLKILEYCQGNCNDTHNLLNEYH